MTGLRGKSAHTPTVCVLCDGTGKLVLRRSWFPADGYGTERCGICRGSGHSDYNPGNDWVREQEQLRAAARAALAKATEGRT